MWLHLVSNVCGIRGNFVHGVDSFDAIPGRKKSRRKTVDAFCGAKVKIAGAPTSNGETISILWPPFVEGARSIGFERCRECMRLKGGKPNPMMGTAEWHAKRSA